jgi:hypothetical protein
VLNGDGLASVGYLVTLCDGTVLVVLFLALALVVVVVVVVVVFLVSIDDSFLSWEEIISSPKFLYRLQDPHPPIYLSLV